MNAIVQYYGTGRRKSSVARVYLRPGTGNILVNKVPLAQYFGRSTLQMVVRQPLELTENSDQFDIFINVSGGGLSGQAGAIKHGISRALLEASEELRPQLKKEGFLTRDARAVERKKYGRPELAKAISSPSVDHLLCRQHSRHLPLPLNRHSLVESKHTPSLFQDFISNQIRISVSDFVHWSTGFSVGWLCCNFASRSATVLPASNSWLFASGGKDSRSIAKGFSMIFIVGLSR